MQRVRLVIVDLDNTLWDWVAQWYAAFDAMVEGVAAKSGLDRELIEKDMQHVFQRHGTSEYAYVIEETECLLALHPQENLTELYADATAAKRAARKAALRLYPGVLDTLLTIKANGCRVVAYTESMEFYSMIRIKELGLDGVIDQLYSPADHPQPEGFGKQHAFERTEQRFTPPGELKPNPKVLLDIIADQGLSPSEAIYVGDSLMKDILMAQEAGVTDVHARYGEAHDTEAYACLRRVTHWTPEDVEKERQHLVTREIKPSFVLADSFTELLEMFDFTRREANHG